MDIITKSDKNYQLTEFGFKALHFIDYFESNETLQESRSETPSFDNSVENSDSTIASNITQQKQPMLEILDRPHDLPPGVKTFYWFSGKNGEYMDDNYFLPLPNPIKQSVSPQKWIKEFKSLLYPLLRDAKTKVWLEDRMLKLAYGTRGLEDYGLMDACLAVPPLESNFEPLKEALVHRGKTGLFATTGMGKSRTLLYLASWWLRKFQTQVLFIQNPKALTENEWTGLYNVLSLNTPKKRDNPRWLVIIEDLHLVTESALEPIRRLIAGASRQTWALLAAFTQSRGSADQQRMKLIQFLKNELEPLDIAQNLDLTAQWPVWRKYFIEWVQWVALDVLVNVIPWFTRSKDDQMSTQYQSPWSLVVSIGFLKIAVKNLQNTMSDNIFPVVLYGVLSELYIIRGEQNLEKSHLLALFTNYYHDEILELFPEGNWNQEIQSILETWSDPNIRLIPPFQYKVIPGNLKKELLISFYHQEWAREVSKVLIQNTVTDVLVTLVNLFHRILPAEYHLWETNKALTMYNNDFLTWLQDYTLFELNKAGQLILTHLRITHTEAQQLRDWSLPPNVQTRMNHTQLLNWTFIKSVISNTLKFA